MRHEGRTAVVTGAAAGIGRAFALRLAAEGAAVAVLDRADATPVVKEILDAGGRAIAVRADLTEPANVLAAQEEVTPRTCATWATEWVPPSDTIPPGGS